MAELPEYYIIRKTHEGKAEITYECSKVKTNADRIRAMSVEELAEWRSQKFYVPNCAYMECPEHDDKDDFSCTDCWLMWLKAEVE